MHRTGFKFRWDRPRAKTPPALSTVYEEFRKHIAASGRSDIGLRRTGCTGRCSREPIVTVFMPESLPVKYQFVDRELVHKIFTCHVLGGAASFRATCWTGR